MEDNGNQDKRKMIMTSIIGVVTLLVLVIGATYAYFNVDIVSTVANSTINIKMPPSESIALNGLESKLHINLKNSDMVLENIGSYYSTSDNSKSYVTSDDEAKTIVAKLVSENLTLRNKCSVNVMVNLDTSLNSMGSVLENDDAFLFISGGTSVKFIDLYDLKETGQMNFTLDFVININGSQDIKSYLKINNKNNSQIYLAGKELLVSLKISNIKCNSVEKSDVEKILEKNSSTQLENLKSTAEREDTLRRFQGTNDTIKNNYICFGTTNKNECLEDEEHHMYRIMGIDTFTNELKIIKKDSLGNNLFQWSRSYDDNVIWPDTESYKAINGTNFLNNNDYVPNNLDINWYDLISDHQWLYGDLVTANTKSIINFFEVESGKKSSLYYVKAESDSLGRTETVATNGGYKGTVTYYYPVDNVWTDFVNAKIGILNYSDFYLAYANTYIISPAIGLSNWIHINNNGVRKSELLLSRRGYYYEYAFYAQSYINGTYSPSEGLAGHYNFGQAFYVRPVFYLSSNITLLGTGTKDDPYIIKKV